MTVIDKRKYMLGDEARQLSGTAKAQADIALRSGVGIHKILRWVVVDIALQTGLRVSEIVRLTHDHVDVYGRSLEVTRSKKKRSRPETIGISRPLADHLRQYIEWKQSRGYSTAPSSCLLRGKKGCLSCRQAQRLWGDALRIAGLPHYGIHGARHTLAVALLRKTNNLRIVQKQLGHASPVTTANLYADVPFEDMQNALEDVYAFKKGAQQ
jgi:integrase/recombinase XerD